MIMKQYPFNKELQEQVYKDIRLKSAILNEIHHNGVDGLDMWWCFRYQRKYYNLNIYDYAEYGKDSICITAYIIGERYRELGDNYEKIVANIFLDKKEWLQLSHVYKQYTKMKALQYSYLRTDAELDEFFKDLIKSGYTYQFEQKGNSNSITENAAKIIYNATPCLEDNIEVGYLLKVDGQGIQLFTKDEGITTFEYTLLNDIQSKLKIIEKLIGY